MRKDKLAIILIASVFSGFVLQPLIVFSCIHGTYVDAIYHKYSVEMPNLYSRSTGFELKSVGEVSQWWLESNFFVLGDVSDAINERASVVLDCFLEYPSMQSNAEAAHSAGLKYGIFISLLSLEWGAFSPIGDPQPELEEAVAKGFDGEPIYQWEDMLAYDTNHPAWQQFLTDKMKEAIDIGADIICVDDKDGSAWWSSTGSLGEVGCFGEYSMDGFQDYLKSKYSGEQLNGFGIDDIDEFDYANYLKERDYTKEEINEEIMKHLYWSGFNPIDVPLFQDFQDYHIQSVKEFTENFISEIKGYAEDNYNKEIVVTGFPWDFFYPEEFQFYTLYDFPSGELHYAWRGLPPRGRAVQYHKLGHSIAGVPKAVKTVDSFADVMLMWKYNTQNLLRIRFAEAYASGGNIIDKPEMIAIGEALGEEVFRTDVEVMKPYSSFILDNLNMFNFNYLESLAEVGVVYSVPSLSYDRWLHVDSWEGVCQLLAHLHVQYDVICMGDDINYEDAVDTGDLSRYKIIFLPQVLALTEKQEDAILNYINNGGTIVAYGQVGKVDEHQQEVDRPQLEAVLKGEINPYGDGTFYYYSSSEIGQEYYCYAAYSSVAEEFGESPAILVSEERAQEIRDEFQELITDEQIEDLPQNVFVQIYQGYGKLFVHLVNYNYDFETDSVEAETDLSMNMPYPDGFEPNTVQLISPDLDNDQEIAFNLVDGSITFDVPELSIWSIIVISQLTEESTITCTSSQQMVTIGSSVTISGSISPGVASQVTIQVSADSGAVWTNLATVTSTSDGTYSYEWTPTNTGSYQVKASWPGDATYSDAESSTISLTVEGKSDGGGIPGFPLEAVLLGIFVTAVALVFMRRKQTLTTPTV